MVHSGSPPLLDVLRSAVGPSINDSILWAAVLLFKVISLIETYCSVFFFISQSVVNEKDLRSKDNQAQRSYDDFCGGSCGSLI